MNGRRIPNQGSKWLRRTTRLAIYIRDGHACVWCGCGEEDTPHLTVDHVLACELGGTNVPSNLVTACLSCNSAKRSLAPRAWLRYLRDCGIDTTGIADRVRKHTARKLDRDAARAMLAARS